jgi:hypothetical protein
MYRLQPDCRQENLPLARRDQKIFLGVGVSQPSVV